jgi:hypothetical protein
MFENKTRSEWIDGRLIVSWWNFGYATTYRYSSFHILDARDTVVDLCKF